MIWPHNLKGEYIFKTIVTLHTKLSLKMIPFLQATHEMDDKWCYYTNIICSNTIIQLLG